MKTNMVQITTYITQEQYDQIQERSYKGNKSQQKSQDKTFSEHLRQALDNYLATNFGV